MKGVILAGGMGTRLYPLTKVTNKHLLPVYDKPMIFYPLETLRKSGVSEIMIVCGREHAGHFIQLLGSGDEYNVKLSYAQQSTNNGGIADALAYAEDFVGQDSVAVILGDNIFEDTFEVATSSFTAGAVGFFKEMEDPRRFGVPVFSEDGKVVVGIEEKPEKPQSSFAQTGFYIFDRNIFSYIKKLSPSVRGELEMTDAINHYINAGSLTFEMVHGEWIDAGTIESLFMASAFVRHHQKNV